jgi:hypothetical protein
MTSCPITGEELEKYFLAGKALNFLDYLNWAPSNVGGPVISL